MVNDGHNHSKHQNLKNLVFIFYDRYSFNILSLLIILKVTLTQHIVIPVTQKTTGS